jgi:thiol-disulfide isomerase/thioredoxin
MPRSLLLSLTCAFALVVAGCDRQSTQDAQQDVAAADQNAAQLSGTIDRSFAGNELPDVELTDPSGATLSLASLRGEPVLINLWATWCAPCVVEMPMLDTLAGETEGSLRVITVSQDMQGADVVAPFFAERDLGRLPQWIDPRNDLVFAYGGASLPLTVLYDAEGREVWRMLGGYHWDSAEARELVNEAIQT